MRKAQGSLMCCPVKLLSSVNSLAYVHSVREIQTLSKKKTEDKGVTTNGRINAFRKTNI